MPINASKIALAFAAFLALMAVARADWQSDLRVLSPATEQKGSAHFKQSKLRMDFSQSSMPMSIIVDFPAKKSITLMHKMKVAMTGDLSRARARVPQCSKPDLEACFKAEGFKKAGSETVNGHPCAVYEKTETGKGRAASKVKVWRPTDIAEMAVVRSATYDEAGSVLSQADFLNLKVAPQDDALFQAPADYKPMPVAGMPGGIPSSGPPPQGGAH